jgi:hypothetical protein
MIARVEVILNDNRPQAEDQPIRCAKVVSFDSNENETEHPELKDDKDYFSYNELVKAISEKLRVEEKIIDVIGKNVIKDDKDTSEEEKYQNGSLYPYKMPEEVDIREDKMSIFEWLRKLKKGQLILNPEFQRHLVWKDDQKSRFIESVLLNLPLPPLYVNEEKSGRYIIVDGLQRTMTLKLFIENGGFKLQGLQVLKDLNDKAFDELDKKLKTKIEDKQLFVYIIKPSVPTPMVYDIFNRINTGGTQLNRQEIRNCIYIGEATRLLKKLSEKEYFKSAIDYGISSKRMKDREAVLRYLAFNILNYESEYKGDMDEFLGEAMKRINKMKNSEIELLKKNFERVMKRTYEFFGSRNFRLPTEKSKGRINIALLESISHFFSSKSDDFLFTNKKKIKNNYEKLFDHKDFVESVTHSTGDRKKVFERFELVHQILGDV